MICFFINHYYKIKYYSAFIFPPPLPPGGGKKKQFFLKINKPSLMQGKLKKRKPPSIM